MEKKKKRNESNSNNSQSPPYSRALINTGSPGSKGVGSKFSFFLNRIYENKENIYVLNSPFLKDSK